MALSSRPRSGPEFFALLACCLAGGSDSLAQDAPEPGLPRRVGVFGAGLREGEDFGTLWFFTAGVRYRTAPNVALGASISHSASEDSCPADADQACVEIGGSITAVELEVEFRYSLVGLQPYGVASLGIAHLTAAGDRVDRFGGAYSTGLGLSGGVAPVVWLFAEVRWRQETFGAYNARGPLGVGGIRWAF